MAESKNNLEYKIHKSNSNDISLSVYVIIYTCLFCPFRHSSPESDQVDARSPGMASSSGQVPYSTTVSAVLSANAQLPFSGDVMNSTAVMSDEVLQVCLHGLPV